jgi:protein-S-isoprenylcysteine O-methyltransferase Ste14
MTFSEAVLLAGYLSLVVELVFFPVPSVASSRQLLTGEQTPDLADTKLSRIQALPLAIKVPVFVLPTILIVILFLLPLLLTVRPELHRSLLPLWQPHPAWLPTVGALLVVLGRLLTFAATLALRRDRLRPLQGELDLPLQTGLLFRRSRNPGLLGMYLFFAGLVLFYPNLVLLAGFAGYLVHMHYRILMEESHLVARYGSAYRRYCQETPRYL